MYMEPHHIIAEAAGLDPFDPGVDPEYTRANVELTNRLLGRTSDEIEQTEAEIREYNDEDYRSQLLADAGGDVEIALRKLYELCDDDEAQVGEMMYEIHKAARRNAHE